MKKNKNLLFWAFIFMLPNLIHFVLFFLLPTILGVWYSFTNFDGFGSYDFVGLQNYIELFSDPLFYKVMIRTLLYSAIMVPLTVFSAFGISLLLTRDLKVTNVVRAMVYWPTLLSSVMIGVTWKWIFSENYGLVNFLITSAGGNQVMWQSDPIAAWSTIIIAALWCGMGFNMLIYIGAINNIPKSRLEAADMEGANAWQKVRYVIFPSVKNTTFLIMMLTTLATFKEFALINTMTSGGPAGRTTLIVQYIYNLGFDQYDVGYASAVSMIMVGVLMVITIIQTRVERKLD